MTWPPAAHDRQRELFSDDAEPCEPAEQAEERRGPPLQTLQDGRVVHTACGTETEPDPSDMTFYCPECGAGIDPAKYHDTEADR